MQWRKIGERIFEERRAAGLTLQQLADIVGVTRQTLSKWEKGESVEIPLNTVLLLCKEFGCEAGYLLCEYDTRDREQADVRKLTGLSPKAIEVLSRYNKEKYRRDAVEKYGSIETISLLIESLRDEKTKGFELISNIKVLADETEKTEEEFWRMGMRDTETKTSEVVESQKILRDAGYVVMDGQEKVEHIKQTTLMMVIKTLPDVLDYIIQSSREKIEEIYCEQED